MCLVENMMSPNKVSKHGDGPGSVNLLGQLRQIEHLDIEPDISSQEQDFETILQHELSLDEDPYEPINELSDHMKELSYPSIYSTRTRTHCGGIAKTRQHCRSSRD